MPWCFHPDCNHTRLIPVEGTTLYCATRNKAIRDQEEEDAKPAKRYKPLQRGAPPKKVSDKRKEQNAEYMTLRDEFLKEHPTCEVCGSEPATEVHHKKGRENGLLLEVQYFLAVDRNCHTLITEDSAFAIREGYSLPRTTSQETPTI